MWKKITQRIAFGSKGFDPVAYWRQRADDPGTVSVMWENRAFNDLVDRDEWAVIKATLPERRGAVLDLGCGTGRVAQRLASEFDDYTGVDLDTMVAEARRRLPALASSFVASTVGDYDFPSEKFDFVLSLGCVATACTNSTLPQVARKIVGSIRPGGRVTLIEPFHTSPVLTRGCKMKPQEVSSLFTSLGMRGVRHGGILCFPARMLLSEPIFERTPRLTKGVYELSERLARRFPSALADYAVLSFEKR
ncbi:bifunctional 2-polyprenyl-6-hydroxyphenol methylase/3-demethylubiquinol 3-O-methyltransferase UbiG [Mycobacterium sp. TY814]|uniref:class I SAM-dependent methyltransferase n=1 Tax=unclassified Mycobacterium TaxID=2642494 RepID=UPI0027421946|nr:class I SAM-dependent methyltransferase [Mycobacterium sp. TY814]MDP7720893.1 class I SAM-dependent methyltransferase [Mycobacterium sp. TY814]